MQSGNAYNPPRPPEVYALPDNLNEALPKEVRETFQSDSNGRVLFFTAPPLERPHKGISHESAGLGHSSRYLAGLAEWRAEREKKRKERDERNAEASRKKVEKDVADAQAAEKEIVAQASDFMARWLIQHDSDTQKWTKEAGLEGWREATKANKEKETRPTPN